MAVLEALTNFLINSCTSLRLGEKLESLWHPPVPPSPLCIRQGKQQQRNVHHKLKRTDVVFVGIAVTQERVHAVPIRYQDLF